MSDVIERERVKEPAMHSKEKIQPPKKHQVIFEQKVGKPVRCGITIISKVFGLSLRQAGKHVREAARTGESVLIEETSEDVAETFASAANNKRSGHDNTCGSPARSIHFKSEPV